MKNYFINNYLLSIHLKSSNRNLIFIFFIFYFSVFIACTPSRILVHNFPESGDRHNFPCVSFSAAETPQSLPVKYDTLYTTATFRKFLRSHHTLAFLVIQNDTIRAEYYAPHHRKKEAIDLFSISKSIVAGVLAIAQQEGYISGLSDKLGDYFTDLPPGFRDISLADLLNMRCGIKESFYTTTKMYYSNDLNKALKQLHLHAPPGQQYEYCNPATQWLVAVIEQTTDMKFSDYFYQKVWLPLRTEYDGSWSLDSRKQSTVRGFCGLNMAPRDLAKFGICYLHNGKYLGQQIIPAGWVENTFFTSPDMIKTPDDFIYNMHWRIITPDEEFLAKGLLGQYMYLNKKTNTVIIRLGTSESNVEWIPFLRQTSNEQGKIKMLD